LRLRSSVAAALVCIGAGLAVSPRAHAATCESLASLAIPNVRITLARTVPAGGFTPPGGARQTFPPPPRPHVSLASAGLGLGYNGGRANARFEELPAFCRVTATVAPSPTSDIRVEVWLPAEGWNGSFRGTGPNGLGGTIPYNSMANALRDGYVTASDDTGHRTAETNWMDDPERLLPILTGQRAFVAEHLLSWLPAWSIDVSRHARCGFWKTLTALTMNWLSNDLAEVEAVLAHTRPPAEAQA